MIDQVVAMVRRELEMRRARFPLTAIERSLAGKPAPRNFAAAIRGEGIKLIAEIKRASPSKGMLSAIPNPADLARAYARGGASAISVLTEPNFFRGTLKDLVTVGAVVSLPLLRKDFILDPYQVYEARAWGADAVLLIVALLRPTELKELLKLTYSLGMTPLVEVHSREELERALELEVQVVGINNRNLRDFSVNLETTLTLCPLIPRTVTVVSESGIRSREEVQRLEEAGVDAVLVGERLVTSPDPAATIAELLGRR